MITNIRIDLDDGQRNKLSRLLNPSKPKSLATRKDVTAFVEGCIAAALDLNITAPKASPKGMSRLSYFRALEGHLRQQGNFRGAEIAARTASEIESIGG